VSIVYACPSACLLKGKQFSGFGLQPYNLKVQNSLITEYKDKDNEMIEMLDKEFQILVLKVVNTLKIIQINRYMK
jgi:hypothetical protein